MRKKKPKPPRQWANTKVPDNDWLQLSPRALKVGCCDCGLVHDMWFRVRKGKLEMFVVRDDKETKILRREKFPKHQSRNGHYRIQVLSYKK